MSVVQNSQFLDLPDEVLIEVLSHSHIEDLDGPVSRTCRKLERLVNNEQVWQKKTEREFGNQRTHSTWKETYHVKYYKREEDYYRQECESLFKAEAKRKEGETWKAAHKRLVCEKYEPLAKEPNMPLSAFQILSQQQDQQPRIQVPNLTFDLNVEKFDVGAMSLV